MIGWLLQLFLCFGHRHPRAGYLLVSVSVVIIPSFTVQFFPVCLASVSLSLIPPRFERRPCSSISHHFTRRAVVKTTIADASSGRRREPAITIAGA